ncbi:MAG: aspartate aminotransferase family protein [Kiritimatiellae bacterium]|nr:aspartate aminotransferase family protein [Kiritimatiellia bacterium]
MKSMEVIEMYNRYVMPTYSPSLVLVRGRGTKVWDANGKVYLDFSSGISVLNTGHCHPEVVAAIREQAGVLMHASNLYYTENAVKLARRLSELSLRGKCFFCNSGAEANECLIKLARLWGHEQGRYEIITMKQSFHGRTLATAAATGQEKIQKGFEPMPQGFVYAEINNIGSVEALVNERTVAVMVEAVQGEGGVVVAQDEFMKALRELCDARNLLLLCDEVQCGLGRTGKWFGYEWSGVKPDAFSLAKGLGSGYPIGAVVSSPKLADVFHPGQHASTFGGTPLACAAALATLDVIEKEGLVARAQRLGTALRRGLENFVGKYEHVKEVRGRGLMVGMVLDQPAKPLVEKLRDMGLLTIATAETVVRMLPPLTVKEEELEEALEICDDALAEWHGMATGEPAAGTAESATGGNPEPEGDRA